MMVLYIEPLGISIKIRHQVHVSETLNATLRLLRGPWDLLGRVSALGVRVRDLTTRVQEP